MTYPTLCFLSYERLNFISTAIQTALDGCDGPVEVIVHDDGSEDPMLLDCLYGMVKGGNVSSLILNAPGVNQGQGIALNRMFSMATGDPIIKLDHDLIFKPGWLATVKAILEDERVGLLGLFKYWHEPVDWRKTIITDAQLREGDYRKAIRRPRMRTEELPRGYSFHTHICGSGFAVPRRVWNRLRPFEQRWGSFGEDWDFQQRVHKVPTLFNALPDDDLVSNQGFGLGPSTVVVAGEHGPEPRMIFGGPKLVG